MTFLHCLHLSPKLLSNTPVPENLSLPSPGLQGTVHDRGKTFTALCQNRQCLLSLLAGETSSPASTRTLAPGPGVCAELLAKLPGMAEGRDEWDSVLLRSLALSLYHHLQQYCFPMSTDVPSSSAECSSQLSSASVLR